MILSDFCNKIEKMLGKIMAHIGPLSYVLIMFAIFCEQSFNAMKGYLNKLH